MTKCVLGLLLVDEKKEDFISFRVVSSAGRGGEVN